MSNNKNQTRLLNTNVNYQLGPFTEMAKTIGRNDPARMKFLDYNAKLQVSTWQSVCNTD